MPGSTERRPSLAEVLFEKRIVVCCGSGGVGKTSLAATLAVHQAKTAGLSACITIDPARRLLDTLGMNDSANADESPVGALPLRFFMVNPDSVIKRYLAELPRLSPIFSHEIFGDALQALVGAQEFLALRELITIVNTKNYHKVIVDTPPTKDALSFLSSPTRLIEFFDSSERIRRFFSGLFGSPPNARTFNPFRLGLRTVMAAFDTVIGLTPLRRLVEFGEAIDGLFDQHALRHNIGAIMDLLHSEATGFVIVTTPTRSNVRDALYFRRELRERHLHCCGVLVNKTFPRDGAPASLAEELAERQPGSNPAEQALAHVYCLGENLLRHERTVVEELAAQLDPGEFLHTFSLLPRDVSDIQALELLSRQIPTSRL